MGLKTTRQWHFEQKCPYTSRKTQTLYHNICLIHRLMLSATLEVGTTQFLLESTVCCGSVATKTNLNVGRLLSWWATRSSSRTRIDSRSATYRNWGTGRSRWLLTSIAGIALLWWNALTWTSRGTHAMTLYNYSTGWVCSGCTFSWRESSPLSFGLVNSWMRRRRFSQLTAQASGLFRRVAMSSSACTSIHSRCRSFTSSQARCHVSICTSGCGRPLSPTTVCSVTMVHPLVESLISASCPVRNLCKPV